MNNTPRCHASIDLERLKNNCRVLKALAPNKLLMAVVKADGYGHGAVQTAHALRRIADMFGVATLDEGLRLRDNGIRSPILVLGYVQPDRIVEAARRDIAVAIFDLDYAVRQSEIMRGESIKVSCHLKIDTGMNRLGFSPENKEILQKAVKLPGLSFEGVFTHFSSADGETEVDADFTRAQQRKFTEVLRYFKSLDKDFKYIHSENTAGLAYNNFTENNVARCGIGLYGYPPADRKIEGLSPVMSLHATIAQIKTIKTGDEVSYNRKFKASEDMRVATVTAGYADGYPRQLSGRGIVSIHGYPAPVLGAVCMDQLIVDISLVPSATVGDSVTLMGDAPAPNAGELAKMCGTISYEILCNVSPRVTRVYL